MARKKRMKRSESVKAKGLPQSTSSVSFAGTPEIWEKREARAMVATIMAVEEEPKEPSFPIWTIMRTRSTHRAMVTGRRGREKDTEIIPPRITPCISI